jgi:hypothetical protein
MACLRPPLPGELKQQWRPLACKQLPATLQDLRLPAFDVDLDKSNVGNASAPYEIVKCQPGYLQLFSREP